MTKYYKSIIKWIYKYFIAFGIVVNIVFFGFVVQVSYNGAKFFIEIPKKS